MTRVRDQMMTVNTQ